MVLYVVAFYLTRCEKLQGVRIVLQVFSNTALSSYTGGEASAFRVLGNHANSNTLG